MTIENIHYSEILNFYLNNIPCHYESLKESKLANLVVLSQKKTRYVREPYFDIQNNNRYLTDLPKSIKYTILCDIDPNNNTPLEEDEIKNHKTRIYPKLLHTLTPCIIIHTYLFSIIKDILSCRFISDKLFIIPSILPLSEYLVSQVICALDVVKLSFEKKILQFTKLKGNIDISFPETTTPYGYFIDDALCIDTCYLWKNYSSKFKFSMSWKLNYYENVICYIIDICTELIKISKRDRVRIFQFVMEIIYHRYYLNFYYSCGRLLYNTGFALLRFLKTSVKLNLYTYTNYIDFLNNLFNWLNCSQYGGYLKILTNDADLICQVLLNDSSLSLYEVISLSDHNCTISTDSIIQKTTSTTTSKYYSNISKIIKIELINSSRQVKLNFRDSVLNNSVINFLSIEKGTSILSRFWLFYIKIFIQEMYDLKFVNSIFMERFWPALSQTSFYHTLIVVYFLPICQFLYSIIDIYEFKKYLKIKIISLCVSSRKIFASDLLTSLYGIIDLITTIDNIQCPNILNGHIYDYFTLNLFSKIFQFRPNLNDPRLSYSWKLRDKILRSFLFAYLNENIEIIEDFIHFLQNFGIFFCLCFYPLSHVDSTCRISRQFPLSLVLYSHSRHRHVYMVKRGSEQLSSLVNCEEIFNTYPIDKIMEIEDYTYQVFNQHRVRDSELFLLKNVFIKYYQCVSIKMFTRNKDCSINDENLTDEKYTLDSHTTTGNTLDKKTPSCLDTADHKISTDNFPTENDNFHNRDFQMSIAYYNNWIKCAISSEYSFFNEHIDINYIDTYIFNGLMTSGIFTLFLKLFIKQQLKPDNSQYTLNFAHFIYNLGISAIHRSLLVKEAISDEKNLKINPMKIDVIDEYFNLLPKEYEYRLPKLPENYYITINTNLLSLDQLFDLIQFLHEEIIPTYPILRHYLLLDIYTICMMSDRIDVDLYDTLHNVIIEYR